LDAWLRLVVVLGLGEAQVALAAREDGRRHVGEMAADGVERLGEAPFDRLRQLVAQLLELGEARLEIRPLGDELLEALLLGLVLLVRERVDLAERLAAALEPLGCGNELLAVVALRRLVRICLREAPPSL